MNLVALSLYVKDEWSSLPLDITDEVVVIVQFEPWLEQDFNWDGGLRWHSSLDRVYLKRVTIVWASFYTLLREVEAEWDKLLVDNLDYFSVLTIDKKRTKLDLSSLKKYVRFNNSTHNQEMLDDFLLWNLEDPV